MNQQEIEKMLEYGNEIFKAIEELEKTDKALAWVYIRKKDPPEEWVKQINDTPICFMEIELVEAIMSRLFEHWYISYVHFSEPIILKAGVAITVEVTVKYADLDGKTYREAWGIATEYAQSIQGLVLATPKAKAMAFKNACREIGALLGRNLNRDLQDERTTVINGTEKVDQEKEDEINKNFMELKSKIRDCQYQEDAIELFNSGGFPYNQELKQIATSKPFKKL